MNETILPPKGFGRKVTRVTMTDKLYALKVGEFLVVPRENESSLYRSAERRGLKITVRRMGSDDSSRVYRVE